LTHVNAAARPLKSAVASIWQAWEKKMSVSVAEAAGAGRRGKPFYKDLSVLVLIAIGIGAALGAADPALGVAMQPLGTVFIKMIRAVIGLVIFFTVVAGIGNMEAMSKVGRLGGVALVYFLALSTFALLVGLVAANLTQPGAGFNVDPATLDAKAVAGYAGEAKKMSIVEFLMSIVPATVTDAFAKGDILSVIFVSVLFGCVLARMGQSGRLMRELVDAGAKWVFGVINAVMWVAPVGVFGAMAFTVGRYGLASLGPLVKLIVVFYLTNLLFLVVVFGAIAALCGFSLLKFLGYIKEEILIVFGTSSSDSGLPGLMAKMEYLGCSKPVVGFVVPTSYIFNTVGSSIYMTMAALFVAQATNTELTLMQQAAIFAVAILTSKGASGVTGAAFIALVATLAIVPTIPLAGMALILGIDRIMSEVRALMNMIASGIAAVVLARIEGELDVERMHAVLAGDVKFEDYRIGARQA
jgi:aerobic C4-dicarboxylate transport protein